MKFIWVVPINHRNIKKSQTKSAKYKIPSVIVITIFSDSPFDFIVNRMFDVVIYCIVKNNDMASLPVYVNSLVWQLSLSRSANQA